MMEIHNEITPQHVWYALLLAVFAAIAFYVIGNAPQTAPEIPMSVLPNILP